MSEETVAVSRSTLARLYGSTRTLVERDDQRVYAADVAALADVEGASAGRDRTDEPLE